MYTLWSALSITVTHLGLLKLFLQVGNPGLPRQTSYEAAHLIDLRRLGDGINEVHTRLAVLQDRLLGEGSINSRPHLAKFCSQPWRLGLAAD